MEINNKKCTRRNINVLGLGIWNPRWGALALSCSV